MPASVQQFLSGEPVVYRGFDRKLYRVTYKRLPLSHLDIRDLRGRVAMAPIMGGEHEAITFFNNLRPWIQDRP